MRWSQISPGGTLEEEKGGSCEDILEVAQKRHSWWQVGLNIFLKSVRSSNLFILSLFFFSFNLSYKLPYL